MKHTLTKNKTKHNWVELTYTMTKIFQNENPYTIFRAKFFKKIKIFKI